MSRQPSSEATAGPDGRSFGHSYQAFEQEGMIEFFARARTMAPVFYAEEIDYWVVTRYKDVTAIFRAPDRFSVKNTLEPVTALLPKALEILKAGSFAAVPVQLNSDRPAHTRIRSIASRFLNAKWFLAHEDRLRHLVESYVDALEGREEVDHVDLVAYELPARVIFLLLGILEINTWDIKRWADNRLLLTFGRLPNEQQLHAVRELLGY